MGRFSKILDMFSVFSNISTVLASFGLVLATSSFISGLQLVKAANIAERKIHRFNGYTTFTIFICLAALSIYGKGASFWSLLGWLFGLGLFLLKIYIVRRRRRRTFKYVSWIGASLILLWITLVFINVPG
ncbi:MAG: hypothetical protein ACE5GY_06565 [Thermodesulfobacteriota bacterium]